MCGFGRFTGRSENSAIAARDRPEDLSACAPLFCHLPPQDRKQPQVGNDHLAQLFVVDEVFDYGPLHGANKLRRGSCATSSVGVGIRLLLDARTQTQRDGWFNITQATLAPMAALSVPSLRRVFRKMEAFDLIESHHASTCILECDRPLPLSHHCIQFSSAAEHQDGKMKRRIAESHEGNNHVIS